MRRAQITVFFSLLLPLFLAVLGASLESAYQQALRSRIQRGLTLCEYSFLSEYQRELWEQYGLFYVDAAYGEKEESREKVQAKIRGYLAQNLSWKEGGARGSFAPFQAMTGGISTDRYSRLTDGRGMGFYEQAVAYEQELWGVSVLASWMDIQRNAENLEGQQSWFSESREREYQNLEVLRQRRLEEEEEGVEDPTDTLWQEEDALLAMVVKTPEHLSSKAVSLQAVPSNRALLQGVGAAGRFQGNPVNDQWLYTYLMEKCVNAKAVFCQERDGGSWLSYEMEYILSGKASDRENLKAVVNRLLLLREGANYAYLMMDERKKEEAYLLAAGLVGITLIPGLVTAVQQIILLGWAYGESILDVRGLLQGQRVPLAKTAESWKLPLVQLFTLKSHLAEYDSQTAGMGQSYEDYLRLLLLFAGREELCMRGLDVVEGNIRKTENGCHLYVDQCIDGLTVQASFQAAPLFSALIPGNGLFQGYIFSAERRFVYEW